MQAAADASCESRSHQLASSKRSLYTSLFPLPYNVAPIPPQCTESLSDAPLAASLVPNDFSTGHAPAAWECYMCRGNSSRLHVPRNKRWVETPRHALLNTSSGVAVTVNNLQPGWTHQILAWVRRSSLWAPSGSGVQLPVGGYERLQT